MILALLTVTIIVLIVVANFKVAAEVIMLLLVVELAVNMEYVEVERGKMMRKSSLSSDKWYSRKSLKFSATKLHFEMASPEKYRFLKY